MKNSISDEGFQRIVAQFAAEENNSPTSEEVEEIAQAIYDTIDKAVGKLSLEYPAEQWYKGLEEYWNRHAEGTRNFMGR